MSSGKSSYPETCRYRCAECVNEGEFSLKSSHGRKLSRKEEKKSCAFEPLRASAFGDTIYVHVLFVYMKLYDYLILILSFHFST